MDLALPVLKASIVLTVFALGLQTRAGDVFALRRRPGLLLRSLVSMNLVMPLVALVLARNFGLHPAVKIALVALALSPVPPLLFKQQVAARAGAQYASGLMVLASLFAVLYVPLALEGIGRVFSLELHLSPLDMAQILLLSVLLPLCLGMLAGRLAPRLAARAVRNTSRLALLLLVLALVPILIGAEPAMLALLGNGTLAAFGVFLVLGLIAGHALGGPDPAERTVLARSTALRHPGVALAIASANFPEQRQVLPAVLWYLVAGALLSLAYARWRGRARES